MGRYAAPEATPHCPAHWCLGFMSSAARLGFMDFEIDNQQPRTVERGCLFPSCSLHLLLVLALDPTWG
jgi:hypothetical protein